MYKTISSKTMVDALAVVFELLNKAYKTFQALNEDRALSPGGVISSTKTYIKSAVLVLDMVEEWNRSDADNIAKILKAVEKFHDMIKKKEEKLKGSNDKEKIMIAKKLRKTRAELRRVEIRLREKLYMLLGEK